MIRRNALPDLSRRRLLVGGGALAAGAALSACTSNTPEAAPSTAPIAPAAATETGKPVRIAFSGPVADHGFLAAINSFAKAQADQYPDVTFTTLEAAADAPAQIAAVQTAIADKPDALIIFPQDGDQLTGVGKAAAQAGIPVINLDRKFNDQSAYRLFLAGDNYKVGFNAGTYIGRKLQGKADAGGHKHFPGNRPSTMLVLERLDPASFGALIALYEHRVFCAGALWDINSFDQWGVELGKVLAKDIAPRLESGDTAGLDASTAALVQRLGN